METVRCQRAFRTDSWPFIKRCLNEADLTRTYGLYWLCESCAEDWKLDYEWIRNSGL